VENGEWNMEKGRIKEKGKRKKVTCSTYNG